MSNVHLFERYRGDSKRRSNIDLFHLRKWRDPRYSSRRTIETRETNPGIFFRDSRMRISRIYRKSWDGTAKSAREREEPSEEREGEVEVEWLAVSGFGFHGSKPSLLYYGQPLTTTGMQRFSSRFLHRVTRERSFRARVSSRDRRGWIGRIFLFAHLTPTEFRASR